jgi:hypothetical protein
MHDALGAANVEGARISSPSLTLPRQEGGDIWGGAAPAADFAV